MLQWSLKKSKKYDTASGYNIAYLFFHPPLEHCPDNMKQKHIWQHLGKLKVTPSVKMFLWKCLHGRIPVLELIHRRFPSTSPLCPYCHTQSESITHCLITCNKAQDIWSRSQIYLHLPHPTGDQFFEWWQELKTKLEWQHDGERLMGLVASICWNIWKARNLWVFEHTNQMPEETLQMSVTLAQQFTSLA
ncbi:uncharacterized protein LOC130956785 [Arachis stenosperma]|uniref:uncharacterized protein LOC130956785 n=1 Tax=Arachis stenosperma TaxID=217475 RepID=UPI0025ABDFDE|nr:uncharacterized protein LOC130956785 [Arachis stenosperma]